MTKQIKFIPAAEAVKVIKTGDHIHLSSVASAPQCLINAMCDRGRNKEFEHVHVHHLRKKLGADVIDTVRGLGFRLGTRYCGGAA